MNGSTKILASHRNRPAVVYVRQSDPKQVRQNTESGRNQRALQERLRELGWKKEQISVIDGDQGVSGKHTEGREAFRKLVADVGLGKIGIILGYEVSRLARNCADWHRLLELCALCGTLIGDSDGVYDPRDFNDRLLLGLKGTMSEAELHSLRLRLDAGRLSKAGRGELVQHLPTGLERNDDSSVSFTSDLAIQERIRLVLTKFRELGSIAQVLRYFVEHRLKVPRRQVSGLHAGDVLWRDASTSALTSIVKNPAYAGAFAYGRRRADPTNQLPGRRATGRLRRPQAEWLALVKDAYPAYISWDEFEQNQRKIAENHERMQEKMTRRTTRGGAALLTGLVRCARCGHTLSVRYKEGRFQYQCDSAKRRYRQPGCQFLSGHRLDEAVVSEFFQVLAPAQINVLESVAQQQTQLQRERERHLAQEVQRLEYEAKRAERQYNHVDPENRLIAATLEQKWERALEDLQQAEEHLTAARQSAPSETRIPADLREAFADVSRRLPELWPRLAAEARKSLLRTLVERVNVLRDADGVAQLRIVWRGGAVTEKHVRVPVRSQRNSDAEQRVAAKIRELTELGRTVPEIIVALNAEPELRPCRGGSFTRPIVTKLKQRHGIVAPMEQLRRGDVPCGYTLPEMAKTLGVHPTWLHRRIGNHTIRIRKDAKYGCYLFPRTKASVQQLKRLQKGKVPHVTFQ